jgi:branched-chain amino acid transport system ATP-binding protein
MRVLSKKQSPVAGASGSQQTPLLEVSKFSAGYGPLTVVRDLDLTVGEGEIVGLLGRNGAGKTTTLLGMAGYLQSVTGSVTIDGTELNGPVHRRTASLLGIVLEGRSVFPTLSVAQNLTIAGVGSKEAMALFPELENRLRVAAGMLSGGEQQMLALARAMARKPRVLLIDELSFGLAPILCDRLFGVLRGIAHQTGMGVLLVEQHIHYAEAACDRVLVMSEGRIQMDTTSAGLVERESEIEKLYLSDPYSQAESG